MKKILFTSVFITTFLVNLIFAGITGKIAGKVTDQATGEGLVGVNIFLEGTVFGATTDLDGNYIILNVSPGKYTMIVQYLGYREVKMEGVKISIDLTTRRSFELVESTLELGEVIVVEGKREFVQKDITSSQSMVSSEEIKALPVVEMSDILQLQAGVTRDAGGGFHIRGGRTSEIAYWVNGISITDAFDNSQGIEIDNNSIQELQVISGTFNAEYGNAMSGIINTVTKEGKSNYSGDVQIYTGDYLSNYTEYFTNIDDFNALENYNFRGSLSGPAPFTNNKVLFFATGRYNYDDGYLYGERRFSTTGDTLNGEPVAMNWSEAYTAQGKLTYWATPNLKFNAELLFSKRDYQDYDHSYKWQPDGNLYRFNNSYNTWFSITHSLSPKAFYNINLSYFSREYKEYLYEDPYDKRYVHPDSLQIIGCAFRTKGTNLHRFKRQTQTFSGKLDFTSQITENHLIKFGAEGKIYELDFDDYNIEPLRINGIEVKPFKPSIPDETSTSRTKYNRKPYLFSGYIQDKIEFDDMIINVGLRLDYFDSKGRVPVDFRDPNMYIPLRPGMDTLSLAEREPYYLKDAEQKWQLSPRFGIAYPISATGVIHFSYGHFLQIPTFDYLFRAGEFNVPESGSFVGPYGNPNLEPEKTVMYELGLQQEFLSDFKIDVTGFYRDVRDWITAGTIIETISGVKYSYFINKDYENVRGLTLTLKKRFSNHYAFDISYTFQIAEGSNSTPEESYGAQIYGNEPKLFLLPMDWDQRHLLNASAYTGGQNWGASLIGRVGSGLPYTSSATQFTAERGITSGFRQNNCVRPYQFVLDLKLHKSFEIYKQRLNIFLRVFNLLDNKVVVNVFSDTGNPDFTTDEIGPDPARPNTVEEYRKYPWHYGAPRRIQLGFEWSF